MNRRRVLALGIAALAGRNLASREAFAQAKYPERPIRLVIPFPPGGVNDAVGRPWADRMKTLLGTVVVENQGGAGGSLGAAAVARAQPDGYTILLGGASSHVINPLASTRLLYDPLKDFESISIVAVNGLGIAVHPSLPVQSLLDLVKYARSNPGQLTYGSTGVGTITHLAAEMFKSLTGTSIVHAPYRGAGPALIDLVSGQIPLAIPSATGQVIELHRSGKLRLLAVTSSSRLAAAPEIPTAVEAGVSNMIVKNFSGLFAPIGTPRSILEQISSATQLALSNVDYKKILVASGFEPELRSNSESTRRFVAEELARWRPIIKEIGLKLDY